jgi:hypothetical protein
MRKLANRRPFRDVRGKQRQSLGIPVVHPRRLGAVSPFFSRLLHISANDIADF